MTYRHVRRGVVPFKPPPPVVAPNYGWETHANCKDSDPNQFFPDGHDQKGVILCARCPVTDECLRFALSWETRNERQPEGIYGGTIGNDRRRNKDFEKLREVGKRRMAQAVKREESVA